MVAVRATQRAMWATFFGVFTAPLVKMVKVRERTAVAGRSPVGVTGVTDQGCSYGGRGAGAPQILGAPRCPPQKIMCVYFLIC